VVAGVALFAGLAHGIGNVRIAALQVGLVRQGLYAGPVDGLEGPATQNGVLAGLSVLALTGCASSSAPDNAVKRDVLQGIAQIRSTHDYEKLRARVARTITRLRQDRAPTAAVRRAKELAIQGFGSTLNGVESEIAFHQNDSGEVAAATRDAARAFRFLRHGASQLRAAGRILGVRVGTLNGL
jgi:hypothetical protein